MYTTFIRPILEYASVVWDVCSQYENTCNKLEKVQLFSARIVTGLPIIVSKFQKRLFILKLAGILF